MATEQIGRFESYFGIQSPFASRLRTKLTHPCS
jgi:hypothetical protein